MSGEPGQTSARPRAGSAARALDGGGASPSGSSARHATTSEGLDIAVHDLGGTGVPIVMAHATGFHGLVWHPVGALLAHDFHPISLDHRGHGDSASPPDGDFEWRGFGRDVLAVIDELGLAQPFGVGHSAGGTAMLLAEQARPGTFRALYLFEPVIIPVDPPLGRDRGNWLAEGARRRRDVFDSRETAHATYSSKPPFSTWDPDALAAYVDYAFDDRPDGSVGLKCRPDDEALVYEMATEHDGFARLGDVACPVMLGAGATSDSDSPGTTIDALAHRLAGGRTELFPGLGHFGPMEDPASIAASIRRFFLGCISA